jgi:5-formyltetrahydrofolate cyclo-ligase
MNGAGRQRKAAVRARMLARRRRQAPERVARLSGCITRRLVALPEYRLARTVLCYFAGHGEVVLDGLIGEAQRAGKRVAVPAWRARERGYAWREVPVGASCGIGRFGIREPQRGRWIDGADAGVAFVPGVAFDRRGNRVGHGAGFYDQLLRPLPAVCRVGVCFAFQVCPSLPHTVRDEPMDVVACESGLLRVRRQHQPARRRSVPRVWPDKTGGRK